ncbi:hypothetical protein ACWGI0_25955 [Streptomyces sp. NPDC054802]
MQHFSDFADDGLDTTTTMAELRALARAHHLAILVTAKVLTDRPDEPVIAAHLPVGLVAAPFPSWREPGLAHDALRGCEHRLRQRGLAGAHARERRAHL